MFGTRKQRVLEQICPRAQAFKARLNKTCCLAAPVRRRGAGGTRLGDAAQAIRRAGRSRGPGGVSRLEPRDPHDEKLHRGRRRTGPRDVTRSSNRAGEACTIPKSDLQVRTAPTGVSQQHPEASRQLGRGRGASRPAAGGRFSQRIRVHCGSRLPRDCPHSPSPGFSRDSFRRVATRYEHFAANDRAMIKTATWEPRERRCPSEPG